MAKLANVVSIDVKPGNMDALLTALLAHKARSLRDESGTLQFEILRPLGDDSRLMTYEVYQDEAAFERHRAAASLAQLLSETEAMRAGLHGTRCAVVG
jgi:autoinducer 2-degrading protein